ncbi:MAG: type II toxin-antitoxin system HicA family toxin [Gammaproteobacteria bacterium]|nr:type II toxin-antitoxin system HicA family toxin [Gammaproteobacteria bacterium]
MNHKQKHTLESILQKQVSGNIHWRDVESLLEALGAELQTTHGARMTYVLNGVTGTVHKPHHSSVLSKQDVRHLRDFFHNLGVTGP